MKYSKEKMWEVWNDDDGTHVEIGPDRDCFGFIEIRRKDEKGKIVERFAFNPEEAKLIAEAILSCYSELKTNP